jgi:hypothetical protein
VALFARYLIIASLLWLACNSAQGRDDITSLPSNQSLDDAWWTGPLLASTAATLPQGYLYVEPYLFDSIPFAHFDPSGHAHAVAHENVFGSLSYINYGLTNRMTVGIIPHFGYDWAGEGGSSTGVQTGDLTVQGQYRLTQFQQGHWFPTISVNFQETLPTGRFDRLQRTTNGFGAGAYTSTLSIYSQTYFWMPTGRILRARLDLSYAFSDRVRLEDVSTYGTLAGFRGYAQPGESAYGDLAFEYNMTLHWVAAFDFWYEHDGNTRVFATNLQLASGGLLPRLAIQSGSGQEQYVAPALEYNWSARVGIIFGARVTVAGRNKSATATPVAAFSYLF